MARYTGPKCRLCRREGVKLFLKGARCETQKCAIIRRQQAPGQHGNPRKRPSGYGLQLREKQKAKRIYGVLEKQFRHYVRRATKVRGKTGLFLLQQLERRLDNVIYRLGLSLSRSHARQLIRQGKINVNDREVNIPSYLVSTGDKIAFASKDSIVLRGISKQSWLAWNKKRNMGEVLSLPKREEIQEPIDDKLIVEFYSR